MCIYGGEGWGSAVRPGGGGGGAIWGTPPSIKNGGYEGSPLGIFFWGGKRDTPLPPNLPFPHPPQYHNCLCPPGGGRGHTHTNPPLELGRGGRGERWDWGGEGRRGGHFCNVVLCDIKGETQLERGRLGRPGGTPPEWSLGVGGIMVILGGNHRI